QSPGCRHDHLSLPRHRRRHRTDRHLRPAVAPLSGRSDSQRARLTHACSMWNLKETSMRQLAFCTCVGALALVCFSQGNAHSQGLSKEEKDQGFVSLFDGKTLEGWKGATKGYVAEEGNLVCLKKGGGNLFTVKEYGDFVFRFDFKFEPAGNNGVSVRGHEIQ